MELIIHDIEPALETVTPSAVVVVDVKSSIVTGVGGFVPPDAEKIVWLSEDVFPAREGDSVSSEPASACR